LKTLLDNEHAVCDWRTGDFVGYSIEDEHILYHPDGAVWMDYDGMSYPDAIDNYITFVKGDNQLCIFDGSTLEEKMVIDNTGYLRPAGEGRYYVTILDEYPYHLVVFDQDLNELHTFPDAAYLYYESDDNGVWYSLIRFEDQREYEYYDFDTFELMYTEPMEKENLDNGN